MPTLPPALSRTRLGVLAFALVALAAQLVAGIHAKAAVTPSFTVSAAPASLSNSNNAGEPSIGVDWKTGNVMYQAYTSTYKITPPSGGSMSWSDVSSPASQFNLDPILYTDAPQGRTLAGGLSGLCSVLSLTDNDGASWTPTTNSCSDGGWDHETVGGGPYANTGLTTPTHTFPDAVYYCSQTGLSPGPAWCARSDNGGLSFNNGVAPWTTQCGGLHGHVKTGPNGYVYLPNSDCGGKNGMAVSKDNGTTWSVTTIPGSTTQDEGDPSVAVDKNNTAFECYQDGADSRVGSTAKMASYNPSTGQWGASTDIGALVGAKNIQFPAAVAGDAGHAACAFLGTSTAGDDQSSGFTGVWHLYVVTTYDGGSTWQTTDVTGSDPVQKGCIWLAGGSNTCRNLLDFMDAQIDKTGHIVVGFADGCTGACATGGATKWDAYATVAYQTGGDPLIGATTTTTQPPSTAPTLSATAGTGAVDLSWTAVSGATSYGVYRGTSAGGEGTTPIATVTSGTTYHDTAVTAGTTYFYTVKGANSAGSGPASNEASATPTAPQQATAPTAPQSLTASAGKPGTLSLQWAAPASNGGSAVTNYKIYRGTSSGGEVLLTTVGNVLTYRDSGLTKGTTYFYKVTAVNAVGESAASNEASRASK